MLWFTFNLILYLVDPSSVAEKTIGELSEDLIDLTQPMESNTEYIHLKLYLHTNISILREMLGKLRKIINRHSICAAQHPIWTYNSSPVQCRGERHRHPTVHQTEVDVWSLSKAGGTKELSFFYRFATQVQKIMLLVETAVSSKLLTWPGEFRKHVDPEIDVRNLSHTFEKTNTALTKMNQEEISFFLTQIELY